MNDLIRNFCFTNALVTGICFLLISARVNALDEKAQYDLSREKVLYSVAYAHLDTQWRWNYKTTINEYIKNTLCRNFDLFEKYPDYVFNFTGSRRYQFMQEYYPSEFLKLKEYIKKGRWFVAGSSVDEGETLIPSPESIIRQILYGNEYFRTEFGVESYDYILPDCFGFSYTMPAVLAHCGIKGFSTQKLTWNCAQGIPFSFGIWQGPDGTEVLAALNPGNYNSAIQGRPDTNDAWNKRIQENGSKYGLFADYHYFGVGDLGGSVRESDIIRYTAASKGIDGKYKIYLTSSDRLFCDVNGIIRQKLPRYKGEFLRP
jgi:alpha-mannosidase